MSSKSEALCRLLVGVCLQDPRRVTDLARSPVASDLDPPYQQALNALIVMTETGPLDTWMLQQQIAADYPGLDKQFVTGLMLEGLPELFDTYLTEFCEGVARRRMSDLQHLAPQMARSSDMGVAVQRMRDHLDRVDAVLTPLSVPLRDGDDLWGYTAPPGVVLLPGLMWRQTRVFLTGFEGDGKSVILRQLAISGALGLNPFKPYGKIAPIRTLLLDLENPDPLAKGTMRAMLDTLKAKSHIPTDATFDGRFRYDIKGQGLDIVGNSADRAWLTRAVATHRPDLLCVGPIYKLAAAGGNLDEATAGNVVDYLNHLRVDYDVAIATEAHAPKGSNDERFLPYRTLAPSGSSVWMRFPEVGRGLRVCKPASDALNKKVFRLERWRGDRSPDMKFPEYVSWARNGRVWMDDCTEEVETAGI